MIKSLQKNSIDCFEIIEIIESRSTLGQEWQPWEKRSDFYCLSKHRSRKPANILYCSKGEASESSGVRIFIEKSHASVPLK